MRYFNPAEFTCQCGCGQNKMDPIFLKEVDELRHRYGKPLVVASGYRCPQHNARVSSTGETGPHTTGRATDLSVRGNDAHTLMKLALEMKFTGIGVSQKGVARFLHFDNLPHSPLHPRPWVWSY